MSGESKDVMSENTTERYLSEKGTETENFKQSQDSFNSHKTRKHQNIKSEIFWNNEKINKRKQE